MADALVGAFLVLAFGSLIVPMAFDFSAHVSRYRVRRREFGADGLSWGEVWKDTR